MNVSFRKSFQRDLKAIKDQTLLDRISEVIEAVEGSATPQQISHLKKIAGTTTATGFASATTGSGW